eukprot:g15411.t1
MIKVVNDEAKTLGVKVHTGFGSADEWHKVAGNSKVSLCPRGYGRTAFHLFEILQLGLIPVHVYLDIPWVPYAGGEMLLDCCLFGSLWKPTNKC